jgi:hypothetical protein
MYAFSSFSKLKALSATAVLILDQFRHKTTFSTDPIPKLEKYFASSTSLRRFSGIPNTMIERDSTF